MMPVFATIMNTAAISCTRKVTNTTVFIQTEIPTCFCRIVTILFYKWFVHWRTNVGRLHNLHVSTNGEFEICRDLYNIPFGTVFLLILLCPGLHVSCLTGHLLWGAFLNFNNNLCICFH